ncbi:MAG: chorismate mutase [Acidobacteriota bacterium]|nr:chorismate mutase [Acidobacteriota bacterium]
MVDGTPRLAALRGAISVERNDATAIQEATTELLTELMERNRLSAGDIVSCIFTATEDLDADFPARAARQLGLARVPLLCAREIPVPGSMARVVRVLIHYYGDNAGPPQHVYLREASALREDLAGAQ